MHVRSEHSVLAYCSIGTLRNPHSRPSELGETERRAANVVQRAVIKLETEARRAVPQLSVPRSRAIGTSVVVVVEGRLGRDNTFRATTLLAKCASRYENAPEKYKNTSGYKRAEQRA